MPKFMVRLKRKTTLYEITEVEVDAIDEDDAEEKAPDHAEETKVSWEETSQHSSVEVTAVDPL